MFIHIVKNIWHIITTIIVQLLSGPSATAELAKPSFMKTITELYIQSEAPVGMAGRD